MTPEFWRNKRILITGHTGFKGAWLSLWLHELGAEVTGYALAPYGAQSLWSDLDLSEVTSHIADINDRRRLDEVLEASKPEIILHLAAQSLVRPSYAAPVETFATNVLGTVNLLHAASFHSQVQAIVVVTSDKCYENKEKGEAYDETSPMGGRDPYSASKGCAELATAAMRASYYAPYARDGARARVATARAGNVIGGGDWSKDRLVPDIIRGCLSTSGSVDIRSPDSVRPWQHVLEPLRGYLMLAECLCGNQTDVDSGWNFGPSAAEERPVIDVAHAVVSAFGKGRIETPQGLANLHEAKLLHLDSRKAKGLGWAPMLDFDQTIEMTCTWYRDWALNVPPRALCASQIATYMDLCGDR